MYIDDFNILFSTPSFAVPFRSNTLLATPFSTYLLNYAHNLTAAINTTG